MDRTVAFYAKPSYAGAGFPVFSGSRRHRGGGILGSLKSMVAPVMKTIGKKALSEGMGLVGDIIGDISQGRNLGASLKSRGLKRLKNVGSSAFREITSSRKRPAPPSETAPKAKRPRTAPSRKRVSKRPIKRSVKKRNPLNF